MIEYIKGSLAEASPLHAVVEINGVGHKLFIPLSNYAKLPQVGKEIFFYVSTVIREDAHKDFGFLTKAERDFFENLIEISGIGPKTALALIGHLDVSDLHLAISQGNVSLICKIPGIGKKTAERLIVELRDKTKKWADSMERNITVKKDLFSDALSALINLGYNPMQAQKAVKTVLAQANEEPELAALITAALRAF